jgi:hypothetical protein
MALKKYSQASGSIYKTYLSNYFVSKTSFDLEQLFFGKKATTKPLKEIVFVTGLARSGTTALFNTLYATGSFASLTYANMPYLLMPNLVKRFFKTEPSEFRERAHQDGILINNKSPEAFDEYFWKAFLADSYVKADRLLTHNPDKTTIDQYKKYMQLIAWSYGKESYLSKNNNNILRIKPLLGALPNAKFIVMYREPLSHAQSLLNQHLHFSKLQQHDPFALDYFNFLGHHEFGLNHKPFYFSGESETNAAPTDLDYWLIKWKNYYRYLITHFSDRFILIAFEDLCQHPVEISAYLNKALILGQPVAITEQHFPKPVATSAYDQNIYADCLEIYHHLNSKKSYEA